MSSSTPLLTHPPRDDPRSTLKDTVTPGKEQSALSWNPPKRGGGKRAGDGVGKQLPKPGVRNSRHSDPVAPVKPPQEPLAAKLDTSASTQLGTSALGTSTILDFSAVTLEVAKRSPRLERSAVVEGSINLEKDKPVAAVNAEKEKPVAAVQRLKAPSLDEGQKAIVNPPEDIPPTALQLIKSSTPVLIPEVASAAKAVTPTRSADMIANKPRKASVVVDISKTRRSSIVEKLSRKTSTVDLPRQRRTSVTDNQRSRRMSVTDRGNPHQSESSRHSSNSDHRDRLAGITPETLRAAEVWKSRTNALKYRGGGGGGGGGRPLHVSFDDMVMDHLAEQKGMSEHKRRHNLHPLARFRSLATTTNNRARRSRRSRNSVYSIDPSLLERPGRIREINSMEEFKERLDQAKEALVCVTFSAKWCGPWRMIKPDVHRLSHIHGDVEFYEIDVDDNEEIAEARRVACMPTFQFFKRGIMLDKFAEPNRIKLDETIRKLRKMEIRPEE